MNKESNIISIENDFKLEENILTPNIFNDLRPVKGFKNYSINDITVALSNTLYSVVVSTNGKPIGMGRIVGDNRITFFIKDVIVDQKYRNKNIGKLIMINLMRYINTNGCNNAYIGLMSTPNNEAFYEKFGFIKRPNNNNGHGMIKYLNKERVLYDK